jgi:hypothetical protein
MIYTTEVIVNWKLYNWPHITAWDIIEAYSKCHNIYGDTYTVTGSLEKVKKTNTNKYDE